MQSPILYRFGIREKRSDRVVVELETQRLENKIEATGKERGPVAVLDSSASKHKIEWHWLKGHAGHAQNERCDELAGEEIAKIKKTFSPAQLKTVLAEFSVKDDAKQTADELF